MIQQNYAAEPQSITDPIKTAHGKQTDAMAHSVKTKAHSRMPSLPLEILWAIIVHIPFSPLNMLHTSLICHQFYTLMSLQKNLLLKEIAVVQYNIGKIFFPLISGQELHNVLHLWRVDSQIREMTDLLDGGTPSAIKYKHQHDWKDTIAFGLHLFSFLRLTSSDPGRSTMQDVQGMGEHWSIHCDLEMATTLRYTSSALASYLYAAGTLDKLFEQTMEQDLALTLEAMLLGDGLLPVLSLLKAQGGSDCFSSSTRLIYQQAQRIADSNKCHLSHSLFLVFMDLRRPPVMRGKAWCWYVNNATQFSQAFISTTLVHRYVYKELVTQDSSEQPLSTCALDILCQYAKKPFESTSAVASQLQDLLQEIRATDTWWLSRRNAKFLLSFSWDEIITKYVHDNWVRKMSAMDRVELFRNLVRVS